MDENDSQYGTTFSCTFYSAKNEGTRAKVSPFTAKGSQYARVISHNKIRGHVQVLFVA